MTDPAPEIPFPLPTDYVEDDPQHVAHHNKLSYMVNGLADGTALVGAGKNPLTGWYHAEGYGAWATDGTLDTGPAVNLAIAAAKAAGGGVVYLGSGDLLVETTYNLSGIHPLWGYITPNSVVLKGAGQQVTRLVGGEPDYGFIELVGSNSVTLEGFSIVSEGVKQYGILGGRTGMFEGAPDRNAGDHHFSHISVSGAFSLAAIFMLASEVCKYDRVDVWSTGGPAVVLARDLRGWTHASAKYAALTTTTPLGHGNGIIAMRNCSLVVAPLSIYASETTSSGVLHLEYAQAFLMESAYILSTGATGIVIDKGAHEATFKAVHQEYFQDVGTQPIGIHAKGTLTAGEQPAVRISIEGSSIYPVIGDVDVIFADFSFTSSRWRGSATYHVDVYALNNAYISADGTVPSISEVPNPLYRARFGGGDNQIYPNRLTTAQRNAQTSLLGAGRLVYDITLHKPIWSDGVAWRDATGGIV